MFLNFEFCSLEDEFALIGKYVEDNEVGCTGKQRDSRYFFALFTLKESALRAPC